MKKYKIVYTFDMSLSKVYEMTIEAKNKYEAYDKAIYETLYEEEGRLPFASYVDGYFTKSGEYHNFNTSFGNAY